MENYKTKKIWRRRKYGQEKMRKIRKYGNKKEVEKKVWWRS